MVAAVIAGASRLAIKWTSRVVVVVLVEYSIIELCICVAINGFALVEVVLVLIV